MYTLHLDTKVLFWNKTHLCTMQFTLEFAMHTRNSLQKPRRTSRMKPLTGVGFWYLIWEHFLRKPWCRAKACSSQQRAAAPTRSTKSVRYKVRLHRGCSLGDDTPSPVTRSARGHCKIKIWVRCSKSKKNLPFLLQSPLTYVVLFTI